MTITPEQAKSLPYSDYPRPWGISHEVIYDARGESDYGWDVGPVTVYDEDLAPLVAAAPDMAEQIAGMQWEYAVEHQHIPGGEWHPVTRWSTEWPILGPQHPTPNERIVRRLVSKPEEIS